MKYFHFFHILHIYRYLDQNNLYGNAQCSFLPTRNFQWEKDVSFVKRDWTKWKENQETGYILEVDLTYPSHLHHEHAENPLAPNTTVIGYDDLSPEQKKILNENDVGRRSYSATKMITSFAPLTKYVVHYMNLQLYLELGMKLQKVHRVMSFKQEKGTVIIISFELDYLLVTKSTRIYFDSCMTNIFEQL